MLTGIWGRDMTVVTQLIQERSDRGLTRRDGHREARTDVQLSLVIPVYNGVGRLPLMLEEVRTFLEHHRELGEVVFVDDGSSDDSASLLRAFVADVPRTRLIALPRNRGKGYAVRRGMLAARGAFRIFTDADLAYPLEDLEGIVLELQRGADVVVACR
ncbi:MAG: glycosyltransferase, partial [Gemmatimonadaceae bacterium]